MTADHLQHQRCGVSEGRVFLLDQNASRRKRDCVRDFLALLLADYAQHRGLRLAGGVRLLCHQAQRDDAFVGGHVYVLSQEVGRPQRTGNRPRQQCGSYRLHVRSLPYPGPGSAVFEQVSG